MDSRQEDTRPAGMEEEYAVAVNACGVYVLERRMSVRRSAKSFQRK